MAQAAKIVITFSLFEPGRRWRWGVLPTGWDYAGSSDQMRESPVITEWFTGPSESQIAARRSIQRTFSRLKARDVVREFSISIL